MRRILIKIQYDGREFYGLQKQDGKRTIQGELESALEKLTGVKTEVFASGRTDKGVHAIDQAVHFDLVQNIPVKNLIVALNNLLPNDISVTNAKVVPNDFHARYSIKSKEYIYKICNSKKKQALLANRCVFVDYDLDVEKMRGASKLLIGKHNFKGFACSATNVNDFEREIYYIDIKKSGNFITFKVCGNGFLYNMVRIIVGTLIDIGRGLLSEKDIINALENQNRSFAGKTMPPEGLYLAKTNY